MRTIITTAFIMATVGLVAGCEADNLGGELFNPDHEYERPTPTINQVIPSARTLAGVGRVEILGSNFVSDPDETLVLFEGQRAQYLEAPTTDRLVVRAPNVEGEAVPVHVTVLGAEFFADPYHIELIPAITERGGFVPQDSPRGIAVDDEGKVYVGMFFGASPSGVIRITPENEREQVVAPQGWAYVDLAIHDNYMYMARGAVPIIYRVDLSNIETPNTPWMLMPAMGGINRLTVDEWGNIWAGGNSGNISHITPDQDRTPVPFQGDIRGLAYGNGFLYVSAIRNEVGGLWRVPVSASGAGEFEQILDFSTMGFAAYNPGGVEVKDNGNVFIGTSSSSNALLEVSPGGEWKAFYSELPDMQPTLTGLALGPDNYLYGARQGVSEQVVRIDLQWEQGR